MQFLYVFECMWRGILSFANYSAGEPLLSTGKPMNGVDIAVGIIGILIVVSIVLGMTHLLLHNKKKNLKKAKR